MSDAARESPAAAAERHEAELAADPDWADLAVLSDAIREADGDLRKMHAERADMYRRLLAAGVPLAQVARRAGVTDMAVRFAVDPSAKPKRRRKAVPAPPVPGAGG